jgi:serine protease Do
MSDQPARPARSRPLARTLGQAAAGMILCLAAAAVGSEQRYSPIVQAVQRARPSVVNIRGEKTLPAAGSQMSGLDTGRRVNGMGTGVVIDPRGYILTNHHVVDGVREIRVTTADEKQYVARLVARDAETDLAVIKIDAPGAMPVVPIGTSSDLMPGETVIAVGNAYGYEHTVTRGIISALHRAVQVSDAQFYDDLIQTDASINPGNSGGPLLNIDGEMIGLNVAVRAGAQGIGFAIPADKALGVAAQLLASHHEQQVYHGVGCGPDAGLAGGGAAVASVAAESPAAASGLKPGDVITAIDEQAVGRSLDFHRALLERKPGEELRLAVRRGDETLELTLALAERSRPGAAAQPAWDVLGLRLEAIAADEFRRRHQTRYRGGLGVLAVREGSPAAQQGVRPGDVLVGMHVWETVSLENVSYILNRSDFSTLSPVKFYILRGGETLYGFLPLSVQTAQRP